VVVAKAVKVAAMEEGKAGLLLKANKILEEWTISTPGYQRIFHH